MDQGIHQDNDPQGRIKKFKTDPCLLYKVIGLRTITVLLHLYDTLSIGDKP